MAAEIVFATNTSYQHYDGSIAKEALSYAQAHQNQDITRLRLSDLKIIFQTQTLAGNRIIDDTVRGLISLKTFTDARRIGIPVFTCDYNSSEDYLNAVFEAASTTGPNLIIVPQTGKNSADARREATALALTVESPQHVLYGEPEKDTLFLRRKNSLPLPEDNKTLIIPSRSLGFFKYSYPGDQMYTEYITNQILNRMMREAGLRVGEEDLDFMFGVRIFPGRGPVTDTMLDPNYPNVKDGHRYSGSYTHLMVPPFKLAQQGLQISPKEVFYAHPVVQRDLEFLGEGSESYLDKRIGQSEVIITECAQHLKIPTSEYQMYIDVFKEVVTAHKPDISLIRRALTPETG